MYTSKGVLERNGAIVYGNKGVIEVNGDIKVLKSEACLFEYVSMH
jgi:hypothetical protein